MVAVSSEKAHTTIMGWEERLAKQEEKWSPPAPTDVEITIEGDEVYTLVGQNLSLQ